jgi:hypothetical protein
MDWMDRWIQHHATTIILVGAALRNFENIAGHSEAANDVMVH